MTPAKSAKLILPGATIGVLGSGQLGRMLALAARTMGYRVATFSPDADSPTGQVADQETVAAYDDRDAARAFARSVDVVTFEFENIPVETVAAMDALVPVRPGARALYVTQNRLREKTFLRDGGWPVTPFRAIRSRADLAAALDALGYPALLKTAGYGYDGKGQAKIATPADADAAYAAVLGAAPSRMREQTAPVQTTPGRAVPDAPETGAILEAWVPYERELSVVGARGADGTFAHFGVIENAHAHGILDLSRAPAAVSPQTAREAAEIARGIFAALEVVGTACVEFFAVAGGALVVNEIAPRPHNSGHLTIEACATSQFAQQLRAVCGLPLGATDFLTPAAMANLLGDVWAAGEPDWPAACAMPRVNLHLYGKRAARPGRKMGHLTALAATPDEAATLALAARARLTRNPL